MTGQRTAIEAVREEPDGVGDLVQLIQPGPGDTLILAFHRSCVREARQVCGAVEADRGSRVVLVPILARRDATFGARLRQAVAESGQGRLVILTLESVPVPDGDLEPHLARSEIVRLIGCGDGHLRPLTRALTGGDTDRPGPLRHARAATVRTPGGTLHLRFDADARWTFNDGQARPGEITVLPAGAMTTTRALVDGTFVADGALQVNRPLRWDVRLSKAPVTVEIAAGEVRAVRCADPRTERFLDRAVSRGGAHRVTQVGIGTNPHIPRFVSRSSPLNLCRTGFHLRLGDDAPAAETDLRIELIAAPPHLDVDGTPLDFAAPAAPPEDATGGRA